MKASGITFWWPWKVVLSLAMLVYALWCWIAGPASPALVPAILWDVVIIVLGGVIHLWHYAILKRNSPRVGEPGRLVSDQGLFRYIRHPMYLGDTVMVAGAFLAARDVIGLCGLVLFVFVVIRLCLDEDRLMAKSFGEEFREWRRRSRLVIPLVF